MPLSLIFSYRYENFLLSLTVSVSLLQTFESHMAWEHTLVFLSHYFRQVPGWIPFTPRASTAPACVWLWSVSLPLFMWRSCGNLQHGRSITGLTICISTPATCLMLISSYRNLSHAGLFLCFSAPSYHCLRVLGAWLLVLLGFIHSFLFLLVTWMTTIPPS